MAIIGKLNLMSSELYIIKQFVEALSSRNSLEKYGEYTVGECT